MCSIEGAKFQVSRNREDGSKYKKIFLKVIVPSLHVSFERGLIRREVRGQLILVYEKLRWKKKKKKRRGRERRKMMKDRASCNMHRIYNTGKSRFIVNLRIPITIPLSALCKDFFQLETFSKPLNSSRWNWNFASREFCVRRILFGRRGLKMFEWKNFTILKAEINLICKSVYNLSSSYEHVCTLTLIDVYIRLNDKISE